MKLRTLIVDDEAPARERLSRQLAGNSLVELIGEAEDGVKAVELIEELNPDLVLLDIQMPGLDGFGVIKMLQKPPLIIFVTAYDEYAIQAFEVNALDYLLKPFTKSRLERAIRRAYQELSKRADFSAKLDAMFKTLREPLHYLDRIAVRKGGKIFVIDAANIDWIGSESGLIFIHTGEERYITNYTLEELENRLNPKVFFRAHRSAIVNLTKIKEIVPWFAGSYRIKLTTGAEVDLSRGQARELRKLIQW
ncbi:MAG: response regulator transcription factor [Dehalococcoidia bacterium]|nr:response regulator transcription factor [Dehalococcoidia bacterium]